MRITLCLSIFLISLLSPAQNLRTTEVKVKVSVTGGKRAKKIYHVLESDGVTKHGPYSETCGRATVVTGHYTYGQKDGAWVYKSPKGLYEQKGTFKADKKVGLWTYKKENTCSGNEYYDDEGKLVRFFVFNAKNKLIHTVDNLTKLEKEIVYLENGDERHIVQLGKNKEVAHFYANGQPYNKKVYKDKKLWSVSDFFNENGELLKEASLINGEGILYKFDLEKIKKGELEVLEEITYHNGMKNGACFKYENGEIRAKGMMRNNQMVGLWEEYNLITERLELKDYNEIGKKDNEVKLTKNKKRFPLSAIVVGQPALMFEDEKKELSYKENQIKMNQFIQMYLIENLKIKEAFKNARCPNNACRVHISFIINTLGEVRIKKIDATALQEGREVLNKLRDFPTFIPASKNGKLVNLLYQLPIVFRTH